VSGTWVNDRQHGLQFRASFLRSSAPTTARAVRIFKTYGNDAVQVMAENPYRLARDIHGIDLRPADAFAGRLGIAPEAIIRLRAGLHYALLEASGNGHCGLPTAELLQVAADLLAVPGGERGAIDPAVAIAWVEQRLGLELAASQKEAVRLALASKVLVITGGPGVGKTTLINAILQILAARRLRLQLCAPTGRAARRMAEATGLEAKTIHRLLEFDPAVYGFRRGADLPLDCDLLVVDESSMVDVPLMASLLASLPAHAVNAVNAVILPDLRPPAGDQPSDFYFVPAYACTIHKSQGSEVPAVVIPLLSQHYTMLRRNLVYAGITRGKRLVVLVGQRKALAMAVRNQFDRRRCTTLADRLTAAD
jgi:ATP-dependent exoDNAse (exonuclease V) alpha subunit